MRAHGVDAKGVRVDGDGLVPEALEQAIKESVAEGKPPRFLYVVPNGSNPCGTTLRADRFRRVYEACAAHAIVIVEDDPYWWLSLEEDAPLPGPSTTFASLDTAGIVVRLDSFAKSVAPGFRLGWLTGPAALVDAFNSASSTSSHNGSPFAMVALHAILEHWGEAGLHAHVARVRGEYRRRMRVMAAAADEHLGGLAKWSVPKAGMFLFLDLSPSGVSDSREIMAALRDHRVLAIPSAVFSPEGEASPHLRLSFSQASDEGMRKGVARLGALLRARKDRVGPGEEPVASPQAHKPVRVH
mmetsp:Transcript_21260/g.71518  ORF Transcript_21260/g.71518 Transcript_21260/m.71518 type:complete len:299 (-) Transcript_21260:134-1030(-)